MRERVRARVLGAVPGKGRRACPWAVYPNLTTPDREQKPLWEPDSPTEVGVTPERAEGFLVGRHGPGGWRQRVGKCRLPQRSSQERPPNTQRQQEGIRARSPCTTGWYRARGRGSTWPLLLRASPLRCSPPSSCPLPLSPVTLKVKVMGHFLLSTSPSSRSCSPPYLPWSRGQAGIRLSSSEGRVSVNAAQAELSFPHWL